MKRRDRRHRNRQARNMARAQSLARFVEAIFYGAPMPERVPSLPNKTRRALQVILTAQRAEHLRSIARLNAEHARAFTDFRTFMTPVLSRLGMLRPGLMNRVPEMPAAMNLLALDARDVSVPTMRTREVDGYPGFAVCYTMAPEMLRFAVGDVDRHVLNVIAEVARLLARIIEVEMVQHIVYGEQLPRQGETIGQGGPTTADEVIAAHPLDAYAYTVRMTTTAVNIADWRTAERFGAIGRELTRRGWHDPVAAEA